MFDQTFYNITIFRYENRVFICDPTVAPVNTLAILLSPSDSTSSAVGSTSFCALKIQNVLVFKSSSVVIGPVISLS